MTTLVFDIDRAKLYTDSRCSTTISSEGSTESITLHDSFVKVFPSGDKDVVYTGTGVVDSLKAFFKAHRLGKRLPVLEGNTCAYVCEKVPTLKITQYGKASRFKNKVIQMHYPGCGHNIHSNGSGSSYFTGAYTACGDISESLEHTKDCDRGTGGEIVVYDLSGRWYDEDKC